MAFRVRWEVGSNNHRRTESRTFDRHDDAKAWKAHVERQRKLGPELSAELLGVMPVAECLALWAERHASRVGLAPATILAYESNFRLHINPVIGHVPIRDLTVAAVEDLDARLARSGVGSNTRQKVLTRLGAVLDVAVRAGYLHRNPARLVRKPRTSVTRTRFALTAHQTEHVRRLVLDRPVAPGNESARLMDAALVSLLAYGGLRVGEARALTWGDVSRAKVRFARSLRDGKRIGTKTGKSRTVTLVQPVLDDLETWREACPSSAPSAPVFPGPDGGFTSTTWYQNWSRRVFRPAVRAAGVSAATPYCLRPTFVTLLIHEGRPPTDVAQQAGHAASLSLDTYGHAYEEFDPDRRRPLAEQVAEARTAHSVTTA